MIPPMAVVFADTSVPNWHITDVPFPNRSDGTIRADALDWSNWTLVLLLLQYEFGTSEPHDLDRVSGARHGTLIPRIVLRPDVLEAKRTDS